LKNFHDSTIAVLAGFMIGSLNKIWPWKETLETIIVDGHVKPLVEKNILPAIGDPSSQFYYSILLALFGIALILVIELILNRTATDSSNPQE
jgi:putative membrane protein